jgi:predicted transcriptional regulator of viral defense system
MPPIEYDIGEVAGRQENVITRAQLLELGVGARVIERRLEHGRWQRLHNGVYLIGPAPPTLTARARARAAALACGDGAVVSHCTAAAVWGLLNPEASDVHVTVCGRNPGPRSGIRTHRVRRLPQEEVTIKLGIPTVTAKHSSVTEGAISS